MGQFVRFINSILLKGLHKQFHHKDLLSDQIPRNPRQPKNVRTREQCEKRRRIYFPCAYAMWGALNLRVSFIDMSSGFHTNLTRWPTDVQFIEVLTILACHWAMLDGL